MRFPLLNRQYELRLSCRQFGLGCILALASTGAWAEGPGVVVADLPVTHSLVSMVMGDIGEPELLMQGSTSPHDHALRPSEARNLEAADLLFWTGRELSPWLYRALQKTHRDTDHIELMRAPDTIRLQFRNHDNFQDSHDHAHDHDTHSKTENGAGNQSIDPHGWLDPHNGIYWLALIAENLSNADPANSATYQGNAAAAQEQLRILEQQIREQLADVAEKPFIVFHDSYHYFEDRFQIYAQAAIALGDAELPGIRRMNQLREQLTEFEGACVFTEPQFSDRLVTSLTRGIPLATGSLDPLGTTLPTGPDLYPQTLRRLAEQLHTCLAGNLSE